MAAAEPREASEPGERPHGAARLTHAWRSLPGDRRICAILAGLLFLTLFLPWYSTTATTGRIVNGRFLAATADASQSGFGAFTFVEAAVVLVVIGVLGLLFARAESEGREFHLPLRDGTVIMLAGAWAALLIIWRLFDKPSLGQGITVGLEWGIFVALTVSVALAWAGGRVRARDGHVPRRLRPKGVEPVDPGDLWDDAPAPRRARRRDRTGAADAAATSVVPADGAPTHVVPRDAAVTQSLRDAGPDDAAATQALPDPGPRRAAGAASEAATVAGRGSDVTQDMPALPADVPVPEFRVGDEPPPDEPPPAPFDQGALLEEESAEPRGPRRPRRPDPPPDQTQIPGLDP